MYACLFVYIYIYIYTCIYICTRVNIFTYICICVFKQEMKTLLSQIDLLQQLNKNQIAVLSGVGEPVRESLRAHRTEFRCFTGPFFGYVGLSCRYVGLFCGYIGLSCGFTGLFCEVLSGVREPERESLRAHRTEFSCFLRPFCGCKMYWALLRIYTPLL